MMMPVPVPVADRHSAQQLPAITACIFRMAASPGPMELRAETTGEISHTFKDLMALYEQGAALTGLGGAGLGARPACAGPGLAARLAACQ